jgi:hypothetical protein
VGARDRANRCDYFTPWQGAPRARAAVDAKSKLDQLFKKKS